jgi:hypothetical protein
LAQAAGRELSTATWLGGTAAHDLAELTWCATCTEFSVQVAHLVTLVSMTVQGTLAPWVLLDLGSVPAGIRKSFADIPDDVAAWLRYVAIAGMPLLDEDLREREPNFLYWQRLALLDRVGLDAAEYVLTTREGREPLYERGLSYTVWQPPADSDRPALVLSREEIDGVLDSALLAWPRRKPLDALWNAYDHIVAGLAVHNDPGFQRMRRDAAAELALEGVIPKPREDRAIQKAVRAIPLSQPWPRSYASYRKSRR